MLKTGLGSAVAEIMKQQTCHFKLSSLKEEMGMVESSLGVSGSLYKKIASIGLETILQRESPKEHVGRLERVYPSCIRPCPKCFLWDKTGHPLCRTRGETTWN